MFGAALLIYAGFVYHRLPPRDDISSVVDAVSLDTGAQDKVDIVFKMKKAVPAFKVSADVARAEGGIWADRREVQLEDAKDLYEGKELRWSLLAKRHMGLNVYTQMLGVDVREGIYRVRVRLFYADDVKNFHSADYGFEVKGLRRDEQMEVTLLDPKSMQEIKWDWP